MRIGALGLLAVGGLALVLLPMAAATHAGTSASAMPSSATHPMGAHGHASDNGCGTPTRGDDNNGVGHDDDHDHDCAEE